jgi:hypothetical protein
MNVLMTLSTHMPPQQDLPLGQGEVELQLV